MIANQKHSSDSIASEQEVIRYTKILAQAFGLNEQNAEVYKKRVKRLERNVKFLETELEDLDECVDSETVVNLIHEIVPLLIGKKGPKGAVHKGFSYSSESSKDSDSVEIIEEYYSKLKECNLSKDYPEWLLKNLFFRGLSPEDILKVRLDGLQALALDDIVERLNNCHDLQEFHFAEARRITDKSISCILNSCPNLRNLDISYSKGDVKDASMLIQRCLSIEYLDFAGVMAFRNDALIVAIIRGSPNLRHLEIGHNDIESSGSEAESESEPSSSESDDEVAYDNDVPPPMIMGTAETPNDFITAFNDYLRQAGGAQNIISMFLS
ncbi:10922_t:CDS:2 [Ambispora gerdemannii]|uniref:10922_t:CDS:1 n=1 Tax=Ambispora gerdemannii TaxID=144530 RepID=A0A9N9FC00_9GLOM|nr:10922_t:CDS:2 [Ambispora gerdemannii]